MSKSAPTLTLVHSRRQDDPPPMSLLARGVFFGCLWLTAMCAPLIFALVMFSLHR